MKLSWGSAIPAALLLIAAAILVLTFLSQGDNGTNGLEEGSRMPAFAAPLARGTLTGDVNLATASGQGQAGSRPACTVRGPQVLNGCVLQRRGPVVLAFLATGGGCLDQLTALEQLQREEPGLQVAAIAVRGDRDTLRRELDTGGWRIPVGYDHDGALAQRYGVIVCPQ